MVDRGPTSLPSLKKCNDSFNGYRVCCAVKVPSPRGFLNQAIIRTGRLLGIAVNTFQVAGIKTHEYLPQAYQQTFSLDRGKYFQHVRRTFTHNSWRLQSPIPKPSRFQP